MHNGQKVRVREASLLARGLTIPANALGEIICRYTVRARGCASPERYDVRIADNAVIWGVAAQEIEPVDGDFQIA
ncbi:MAG: hypothetical protein KGL46_11550 [Hyphomicrobiales bacterium]|nr:hypothetical protein [Hyphomicrobiales bacterium]